MKYDSRFDYSIVLNTFTEAFTQNIYILFMTIIEICKFSLENIS